MWVSTNVIPSIGAISIRLEGECKAPNETEVTAANGRFIIGTLAKSKNAGTIGKFDTKVASGLELPFIRAIVCKHNTP